MGDGSLSQDEIDALLQGADDMLSPGAPAPAMPAAGGGSGLPPHVQGSIQNIINGSIGAVAPALSGYLGGKTLTISNAMVQGKSGGQIRSELGGSFVQVMMDYTGAVNGRNVVIYSKNDAGTISALMMGDETGTPPGDLSEAHQSTIQEFSNQLLSSLATQIGSKVGGGISTTPATLTLAASGAQLQVPDGDAVLVTYDFSIAGITSSKFYHVMDVNLAMSLGGGGGFAPQASRGGGQSYAPSGPMVNISPVQFPPLDMGLPPQQAGNISLLLDVEMTLTVELGRTKQLVQDILGLGEGSIIELDKLAGEPVDLLVNGKLIAKGEVVVIDENFGVRVTDIVSPADRLTNFQ